MLATQNPFFASMRARATGPQTASLRAALFTLLTTCASIEHFYGPLIEF